MIVERIILVKAMKHVFREIMRNTPPSYLQQAIAHGLNAVFASNEIRSKIESGEITIEAAMAGNNNKSNSDNNVPATAGSNGDSKKKRNKGKKAKKHENEGVT